MFSLFLSILVINLRAAMSSYTDSVTASVPLKFNILQLELADIEMYQISGYFSNRYTEAKNSNTGSAAEALCTNYSA